MLRLTILGPSGSATEHSFYSDSITIGRAPENQLQIEDPAVSSRHGRLDVRGRHLVYVDLGSTNGTIVFREGRALAITGRQVRGQIVGEHDRIKIGPHTIRIECADPRIGSHDPTVLESQIMSSVGGLPGPGMAGLDPRQWERTLALLSDAQATIGSFDRLTASLRDHLFRLFPKSTHLSLILRDSASGRLQVAFHTGSSDPGVEFRVSHTILRRVMEEEAGVLVVDASNQLRDARSVVLGGIETAICAPLRNEEGTFGALQLDVRERKGHRFDRDDLHLLVAVADLVALVLDNHRQHRSGRSGLLAALDSLLREREATNPESVSRARRANRIAEQVGRALRLPETDLSVLSVAASLTAWPRSRAPMLVYPDGLLEAVFVSSCRHERSDGSGPLGLTGALLPVTCRALSLAYHVASAGETRIAAMRPELEGGRGSLWDGGCLDALLQFAAQIESDGTGVDRAA